MNIRAILEAIQRDVAEIKETVSQCPKKKLPFPAGYNPSGRRRCSSQRLFGGLKDPEIRAAIMRLNGEGKRLEDIAVYIRENWPRHPEKHVPRSTVHRFLQNARIGRLREYGIEPPIQL